eukprot:352204-Chlamydomonas_euryale.AAC.9
MTAAAGDEEADNPLLPLLPSRHVKQHLHPSPRGDSSRAHGEASTRPLHVHADVPTHAHMLAHARHAHVHVDVGGSNGGGNGDRSGGGGISGGSKSRGSGAWGWSTAGVDGPHMHRCQGLGCDAGSVGGCFFHTSTSSWYAPLMCPPHHGMIP